MAIGNPTVSHMAPASVCDLQSEEQEPINTKIIDWARVLASGVAKQQEVSLLCCRNNDFCTKVNSCSFLAG